jgi:hypothetical protein
MPHLWRTALHGNTPAIDWSTCFFAVEMRISLSILPSVSRPWFGRSRIHATVRGSVGGEASAAARPRFGRRMRLRYSSAAL